MLMGLTFGELIDAFTNSWNKRRVEAHVELLTAEEKLNPITEKWLEIFRKTYPEITVGEAVNFTVLIMALMDTIVLNNKALAKGITPDS